MITRRLFLPLLIFSLISTMSFAFPPPDGKGGGKGGGGEDPPELPNYSIEYLGTLGGTWSMTYGMNNYGDVVGAAERADGTGGPYVYTTVGRMKDLNEMLPEGSGWILMTARDINDSGQIVGYGYPDGASGTYVSSAYRYTPPQSGETFGTVENLGVPGPDSARATAINNNGDVAGIFSVNNEWHSFLWFDGDTAGYQDLGTLAGNRTLAEAINDRDANGNVQVAGYADTSNGRRAWRYDSATLQMEDLGVLSTKVGGGGLPDSRGLDINYQGDVVGWSSSGRNKWHAFLDVPSAGMQDLGTLGGNSSQATGVNDAGEVVGMAQGSDGVYTAFVFQDGIGMFALESQTSGLDFNRTLDGQLLPWRINVFGQICGPGEDSFNFSGIHGEAYILTPNP